jgi:hypothetical protein
MCTILLPPGVNPAAVNKYINIYIYIYIYIYIQFFCTRKIGVSLDMYGLIKTIIE